MRAPVSGFWLGRQGASCHIHQPFLCTPLARFAGEGEGVRVAVSRIHPLTLALSPLAGGEGTERILTG